MVSLSYSAPAESSNDPVFVRTHFLGRVASDASGLDYHHELLKRRSSRHSELNRCDASWLVPVTHLMSYDSDDTTDDDDDDDDDHVHPTTTSPPALHIRSRSSTLPLPLSLPLPLPLPRARSMTAPSASSSSSSCSESFTSRKHRTLIATHSRLMPAHPLTINTAQPLRLAPSNLSTVAPESSLCIVHESDGSCHGDAGDHDPEAQLAASIEPSPPIHRGHHADIDDDEDAQSIAIQTHRHSCILRFAQIVLDFSSSTLEKLIASHPPQPSLQPPPPVSPITPVTPKQLSIEANQLIHRHRKHTTITTHLSRSTNPRRRIAENAVNT